MVYNPTSKESHMIQFVPLRDSQQNNMLKTNTLVFLWKIQDILQVH